jgi:hypothetical protein
MLQMMRNFQKVGLICGTDYLVRAVVPSTVHRCEVVSEALISAPDPWIRALCLDNCTL